MENYDPSYYGYYRAFFSETVVILEYAIGAELSVLDKALGLVMKKWIGLVSGISVMWIS